MTDEIRAKILGLNSARLYGVDPEAVRRTVAADTFAMARAEMLDMGPRPVSRPLGPRTRRDFLRLHALEDAIEKVRRGIA